MSKSITRSYRTLGQKQATENKREMRDSEDGYTCQIFYDVFYYHFQILKKIIEKYKSKVD